MKLKPHDPIPDFESVSHLDSYLTTNGCERCSLGFQNNINGCCVSRGNPRSKLMLVGEGPGKDEDSTRKPFTGPAGRLLDRIWASVGWDTNDWYLTNVVLCRPVAPTNSGKQNLTPKANQIERCAPFLNKQIQLLKPRLIVTLGAIATAKILKKRKIFIGQYRGKLFNKDFGYGKVNIFPMFHSAYILHSRKYPEKEQEAKQLMWNDIRKLKEIVEKERL